MKQWHCGVRSKTNGKLLAFISAVPQTIRIYEKTVKMVEINFLCVHKRLRYALSTIFQRYLSRSKRVAPVLIREITRRVNLEGIFQAAYTAGVVIPKPIAVCRYDLIFKHFTPLDISLYLNKKTSGRHNNAVCLDIGIVR